MFHSPLADLAVALGLVAGSILVGAQAWVPRDHMPRAYSVAAGERSLSGGDAGRVPGDWWCLADLASGGERLDLRPTADGHVIALLPGAAGSESGWVSDPTIGAVLQRVTRPADVAWVPRAVLGATVVSMDGADSVASDPAGTPRWRVESQAGLLFASPLLLSTRGRRSSAVSAGTLPARA